MYIRACKLSFTLELESNNSWMFQRIISHRVWTSCERSYIKGRLLDCVITVVFLCHSRKIGGKQRRWQLQNSRNLIVDFQRPLLHYSRKAEVFFCKLVNKRPQSVRHRGEAVSPIRALPKALWRVSPRNPAWYTRSV
ncbi:GSCOCG00004121001-RA-CDS [Cotesia congregata]|nr:GSCOCG00004121001-RA-CDS [Cotesia congregata]